MMRASKETGATIQYQWPTNNAIKYDGKAGGDAKAVSGRAANFLMNNSYGDTKLTPGDWSLTQGSNSKSPDKYWGFTPGANADSDYDRAKNMYKK